MIARDENAVNVFDQLSERFARLLKMCRLL